GAAKLRLLAGSYGTHLALAAIRAHEGSYDRVVLVGVVGPDHLRRSPADSDEQFARISRLAAASTAFDKGAFDLTGLFRRVRDRLRERPATVVLETPDGDRRSIVIGGFELEWYTRSLLTSRDAIAHLPALLLAMDAGDFTELARASDGWRSASFPSASIFTHRCGSAGSPEREVRIAKERDLSVLGDATDFAERSVCRAWGIPPLPPDFREAVRSILPTLLISGTLDGDAPETNAIEVLRGFPNGIHLSVDGATHALLGLEESSAREAILRFFAGDSLRARRIFLPALAFERRVGSPSEPLLAAGAFPQKSPF
ncbi:MAG TPA: alpha/beta hydrolase, partial [Thermoanaerobaculia bacterium]